MKFTSTFEIKGWDGAETGGVDELADVARATIVPARDRFNSVGGIPTIDLGADAALPQSLLPISAAYTGAEFRGY